MKRRCMRKVSAATKSTPSPRAISPPRSPISNRSTGRNLRAFGFDMYSEPVRRAAMEAARDTGAAALSGKVVLVQEGRGNASPAS